MRTNSKIKKMPNKPGVYFFLKGKEILYIGKATSLRDRVRSYFGKDLINTRGPVILDMITLADNIDWKETDSVLEALILEAELIKKYQPRYNTKEKSNKSWNYVCITKEEIPKVLVVRGKEMVKKSYQSFYGPYTNGSQLKEAMKIIRRIFPFVDESSNKKTNYEFYKQLSLTPSSLAQYKENIKNLKIFFKGKKKDIMRNLKKEMKKAIKEKEFEHAGEIKRQLFALAHINDIALLKNEISQGNNLPKTFRIEAYDIAHMSGKNMVGVMTVVENNEVIKSEYKRFKIRTQSGTNDIGALTEILERRLVHLEWRYPDLIVVDGSTAQINATKKVLAKLRLDIPVVSVIKDEMHRPRGIGGDKVYAHKYERLILLSNSEAHRFAIAYHKNMRAKNFLK
jgi:excinuclease ABC subunit C